MNIQEVKEIDLENKVSIDSEKAEVVKTSSALKSKKPECRDVAYRIIQSHAIGGTRPEECFDHLLEWLEQSGCKLSEQELETMMEEVYSQEHKVNSKLKNSAEIIKERFGIIYSANKYYQYREGCYREIKPEQVVRYILETFKKVKLADVKETEYFLKAISYIDPNRINAIRLLNLRNGLFDIENYRILPHSPKVYSTIQLDVELTKDAKCEKWLKTIDEILGHESAQALQEFFGLCLTQETKYEKALVCLGEGANGKSVVLGVLGELLGKENYSAIPLERFDKSYYVAKLFGKLVRHQPFLDKISSCNRRF